MISDQFDWLLPPSSESSSGASPAGAESIAPVWSGNEAVTIALATSTQPTLVLFKESQFPGWSAELVSASGSRQEVEIVDSEYDYMLMRLDSVPAGSRLELEYRPPWSEVGMWLGSAISLAMMLVWLAAPSVTDGVRRRVGSLWGRAWGSVGSRYAGQWKEEDN